MVPTSSRPELSIVIDVLEALSSIPVDLKSVIDVAPMFIVSPD